MTDQFEVARKAHRVAIEAEKAFDATPTAENAFAAYRIARDAWATGYLPDGEANVDIQRVSSKTLELRKIAVATPLDGYVRDDITTIAIASHRLVTLLNRLDASIDRDMKIWRDRPNDVPEQLQDMQDLSDTLRDIMRDQRSARIIDGIIDDILKEERK
jgi:hypothetical protein